MFSAAPAMAAHGTFHTESFHGGFDHGRGFYGHGFYGDRFGFGVGVGIGLGYYGYPYAYDYPAYPAYYNYDYPYPAVTVAPPVSYYYGGVYAYPHYRYVVHPRYYYPGAYYLWARLSRPGELPVCSPSDNIAANRPEFTAKGAQLPSLCYAARQAGEFAQQVIAFPAWASPLCPLAPHAATVLAPPGRSPLPACRRLRNPPGCSSPSSKSWRRYPRC